MIKVAVLPGDGIGIEVTHAVLPVIKALNLPLQAQFGDIGWSCWRAEGTPIPERTWQLINESDTVLLGAITSKPEREAAAELAIPLKDKNLKYISPIIQLRQQQDLFANVRPCFNLKDEKPFNFCVIRENTEGLYAGFDYHPLPKPVLHLLKENQSWQHITAEQASCALRIQSEAGLMRLFAFAFQYAQENHLERVTFADKPNVLRQSSAFARHFFEQTSQQYPQIRADILNVDAVALWMIQRPEQFGVIVSENMFGDILSDVGAGMMGGLGFAPSANIGAQKCYFEPVHGSGPLMRAHSANPCAMFLTLSMLLSHFGYPNQAHTIHNSVVSVVKEQRTVTPDLGGQATTMEMAHAIIDRCLENKSGSELSVYPKVKPGNPANQSISNPASMDECVYRLAQYSSSELADALDSCGVEGALHGIKPLAQGMKSIGPAYTVQYKPVARKHTAFKNAANYIDHIPEHSVVVIDNEGRTDCTVWGDILTQVAQQKELAGTVVHGAVRDVSLLKTFPYPLFCNAVYMRSGKNRLHMSAQQCPLIINQVIINPGDIMFADDNGVLVIPRDLVGEVLIKAQNIQRTEQAIKAAIASGSTLEHARHVYRYDQPWLDEDKK